VNKLFKRPVLYFSFLFPLIVCITSITFFSRSFDFVGSQAQSGWLLVKNITIFFIPISICIQWLVITFLVYNVTVITSDKTGSRPFTDLMLIISYGFLIYIISDLAGLFLLNTLKEKASLIINQDAAAWIKTASYVKERSIIASVLISFWCAFISRKHYRASWVRVGIQFVVLAGLLIGFVLISR